MQDHHTTSYGAHREHEKHESLEKQFQKAHPHLHQIAKQKNELPPFTIVGCTLAPTLIFIFVNWVRSLEIHYENGLVSLIICLVVLAIILSTCAYPAFDKTAPAAQNSNKKSRLFAFMLFSALLAWSTGFMFGDFNFNRFFKPYFDVSNLSIYPNTDPHLYHGQQFLDAGVIEFAPGSHVSVDEGFGFKNGDVYCVAPIKSGLKAADTPFANYDFWAVGKNCCSSHKSSFQCGEYNNEKATKGLRLMNGADRAYYRLAVEGACAQSSIGARYPLFFHWMAQPELEIDSLVEGGWKYFFREIISYFVLQLFLTVIAFIAYIS